VLLSQLTLNGRGSSCLIRRKQKRALQLWWEPTEEIRVRSKMKEFMKFMLFNVK
jgi:hypothetical protein